MPVEALFETQATQGAALSEDSVSNSPSDATDSPRERVESGSTARRSLHVATTDQKTVISKRRPASTELPGRPARPTEVGEKLAGAQLGHYLLEEFIGGGGMGAVFRGQDTMLGRTVAVKVVPNESADEETIRRFRNEAQSAARLDHPNIARVYYVGEDKGWNYIVFEYIEGVNVRDLVKHRGVQSVAEAVGFTIQVAEAIAHAAHRDVIHRDIKPSNILVTPDGRAKLVDMGLARLHQVNSPSNDLTATGVTLGTFDYISPEQARDPRCTDVRSDLYSLGCTLYYMLTGLPPFPDGTVLQKLLSHSGELPPDPREVRPQLDEELAAICLKLMAKQPSQRHQSPPELIADLLILAQHLGLTGITASRTLALAPREGWLRKLEDHLPWLVAITLFLVAGGVLRTIWTSSESMSLQEMRPRFVVEQSTQRVSPGATTGRRESADRPSRNSAQANGSELAPGNQRSGLGAGLDSLGPLVADRGSAERTQGGSNPTGEPVPTATVPSIAGSPRNFGEGEQPVAGGEDESASPGRTPSNRSGLPVQPVFESPDASSPIIVVADSADGVAANDLVVSSLDDAFAELARDPGIAEIELRFNQRLVQPLRLDLDPDRELTIRAAEGFEPLIVFHSSTADLVPQRQMLKLVGGTINFVGVHIHLLMPYEMVQAGWSIYELRQVDTLTLTRCTLTLQSHFDADAAFFSVQGQMVQTSSPHIELRSCFVRGQANLVRAAEGLPFSLDWEQGLFTSTERMIEAGGLQLNSLAEVVRIDLSNVTASMTQGLCLVTVNDVFPNLPTFVIDCQNCVLSHDSAFPLISYRNVSTEDDPETRFVYAGKQNLYESTQVFWSIGTNDNRIRNITWDERRQYRDWYDEAIAERQVRWEDPYGSMNRPRVDKQSPQHFLLDRRKDKLAGFDRLEVPVAVEPSDG